VTVPAAETSPLAILVIGAGQAGLSAAYHLRRLGLDPSSDDPARRFQVLDQSPGPGGAWQFRWPSLTLTTVNGVHDLPGMAFADILAPGSASAPAAAAVPGYYREYERRFGLAVRRPVSVRAVCGDNDAPFRAETSAGVTFAQGLINATGTWDRPFIPHYPGSGSFAGAQLHTQQYRGAAEFAGKHVVIIGGGISAVQILDEVSQITTTMWVTRSEPRFRTKPFTADEGRAAVALVEQRVRAGLPPGSVVSVTGLPEDDRIRAARARGALRRLPMFSGIQPDGVYWADCSFQHADVLLWCTGFRSALDHLAPLRLRGPGGGITMVGPGLTAVAGHPRVHLVGYGPSASTIGANRAGRAAAVGLARTLGVAGRAPLS
jgi:cation diffusion facilitator CzcD-associated flavoprotein CzcO